ncbi:MAG TPA: PhoU domain-containing protein [Rubricoccaceae bacterium]|jgi:phosphate uptake regulator
MQLFSFLTGAKPPLIEQSLHGLADMLDTAGEMFAAATASLLDNEALEMDLSALDAEVNARERQIRRAVADHVSSDPRAQLALSLVLVSIVQDAERCGDLAKSLAKTADLADHPRMGPHVEALRPIRDRVQQTFPRVRAAFLTSDTEAARAVMEENDRTKAETGEYLQRLAAASDLSPNLAVVLAVGSRMIGRTGSHLSNIISSVALPFDQIRRSPTWNEGGAG